jgi:Flp pilus assembly protein CpaB
MRFQEIVEAAKPNTAVAAKLWTAPVKITQPNYVGYIDVAVTAPNIQVARVLLKAQYGVQDWHIGSIKEVK